MTTSTLPACTAPMLPAQLPEAWHAQVLQLAQLLPQAARQTGGSVLLLGQHPWSAALRLACLQAGMSCWDMPLFASQAAVAQAWQTARAQVVVCPTEVFGWVSKIAFVGGAISVFTCNDAGEGTLLQRANHQAVQAQPWPSELPQWALRTFDAQGQLAGPALTYADTAAWQACVQAQLHALQA